MSTLNIVWTVLVPLVEQGPDPEDVKPGWLGFGVFLLLAAAVVFLAFSFTKQLRKARNHFEAEDRAAAGQQNNADGNGPEDDSDRA
jgi:hypothetical protein